MPNVASPPFERMSPDESSAAPASETAMAVNSRRFPLSFHVVLP